MWSHSADGNPGICTSRSPGKNRAGAVCPDAGTGTRGGDSGEPGSGCPRSRTPGLRLSLRTRILICYREIEHEKARGLTCR